MISRERIRAALHHQETDEIPIDLAGYFASGMAAIAYKNLRKYLDLEERPIRVYDPHQVLAVIDEDVLHRFGVDTVQAGRMFDHEDSCWKDGVLPDGSPCQWPVWASPEMHDGEWVLRSVTGKIVGHRPEGVLNFEPVNFPFVEHDSLTVKDIRAAIDNFQFTGVAGPYTATLNLPDGSRKFGEAIRRLYESTDRAIILPYGGHLLELGQWLYRADIFYMMMGAEPARTHEFLDRVVEIHLEELGKLLKYAGPYVDVVALSEDLGGQQGPLVSLKMFREFFKERHKMIWNRIRQLTNAKVMLHSCGAVRDLIPDLIEAGVDILNPIQIDCPGMDVGKLKAEYGKDLVFWGGGCDTHRVLPFATPAEVQKHVREQVKILRQGGGFIFQQVHNILADVPPQNIVAMYEAAHET
jgi:uroporphyrinogen decarboxylase